MADVRAGLAESLAKTKAAKKLPIDVDEWAEGMSNALRSLVDEGYVVVNKGGSNRTNKPVLSDFMELTPLGRATYFHVFNTIKEVAPEDVRNNDHMTAWEHMHNVANWLVTWDYSPFGNDFYKLYGLIVWGGQVDTEERAKAEMTDGWREKFNKYGPSEGGEFIIEQGRAPHPLSLLPKADRPE